MKRDVMGDAFPSLRDTSAVFIIQQTFDEAENATRSMYASVIPIGVIIYLDASGPRDYAFEFTSQS